jgi:hypothetical protein
MRFDPGFSVSSFDEITVYPREVMITYLFDFIENAEIIVVGLIFRPVFKGVFSNSL